MDTLVVPMSTNYLTTYLAAFSIDGTAKWLRLAGGPNPQAVGFDFAIDTSGNCYITGSFKDTALFNMDTLINTQKDAFIAKYDINGNEQWVKQLAVTGSADGVNISSDKIGNVYLTGRFSGSAKFGNDTINSISGEDCFVSRYNSNGDCLGVKQIENSTGTALCSDNNSFYIVGSFTGFTNIGSDSFTSYGNGDIFIAKGDAITNILETMRKSNNQLVIYANPTTAKCNITIPEEFLHEKNLKLNIYDNAGKIIQQKTLEMDEGKIKINLEQEAKGIYNVILSNGKKNYSGKIVFE